MAGSSVAVSASQPWLKRPGGGRSFPASLPLISSPLEQGSLYLLVF